MRCRAFSSIAYLCHGSAMSRTASSMTGFVVVEDGQLVGGLALEVAEAAEQFLRIYAAGVATVLAGTAIGGRGCWSRR